MGHDQDLSTRIRALLAEHGPAEEKRVFGTWGFLLGGHLVVCAGPDGELLVRVPAGDQADLLEPGLVEPMTMGERVSRTWVEVAPDAVRTPSALAAWVDRGVAVVAGLPPKGR